MKSKNDRAARLKVFENLITTFNSSYVTSHIRTIFKRLRPISLGVDHKKHNYLQIDRKISQSVELKRLYFFHMILLTSETIY